MFREEKKKKYRYKILLAIIVAYVAWFGLTFNTRYNEYFAQKEYCASLDLKYSNQTTVNIQSDELQKMLKDIVDCAIFKSSNNFFPISLLF